MDLFSIINEKYMKRNRCYSNRKFIIPRGIMIHSTASPGIMASEWFERWNNMRTRVCVHAFVDDKDIYQYLPWNYMALHCDSSKNGSGNDTHISIDLCEPGGHKILGSSIVNSTYDISKNRKYFEAVWNNSIKLCVELCKKYGLTKEDIIDHNEGYKLGIASNHADTKHWFIMHDKCMDDFRNDIKKSLDKNSNN